MDCDYSLEEAELTKASSSVKDFISMLLIKDPKKRFTADQVTQLEIKVEAKVLLIP